MKWVLVVDDEPVIRSLIVASLSRPGLNVVEVADGTSALETARQNPPDLILLDVGLPGIRGDEVARRLRSDPSTADIPILYLTGLPADASDADGVIDKPFTPNRLKESTASWLEEN
jgi:two-component system, OmpR family, alkaline phosphatase synthesis response regulator PhoP